MWFVYIHVKTMGLRALTMKIHPLVATTLPPFEHDTYHGFSLHVFECVHDALLL